MLGFFPGTISAILRPLPGTVCHAGSPPLHHVLCPMLKQWGPWGLSLTKLWWLQFCRAFPVPQARCWMFAPVLGAPWGESLVPLWKLRDLLSPMIPTAHVVLATGGMVQNASP